MLDVILEWAVISLPTLFAIAIEVIDDKYRKESAAWRLCVIAFGVAISGLTYFQVMRSHKLAAKDRQDVIVQTSTQVSKSVTEAVSEQYSKLIKQMTDQNAALKARLDEGNRRTQDSISSSLSKVETNITTGLGKVGKPDPPAKTKIEFTLWSEAGGPILTQALAPDDKGIFTVEFSYYNSSPTQASNMDTWIAVCDACSFAEEPVGYDRPTGLNEHVRHKMVPLLNPGTSMEKSTIKVKLSQHLPNFAIGFRYACSTCDAPQTMQTALISALWPTQP